jgi:hypothetical protein
MAPSQLDVETYLPIRTISQIYYGKNMVEICLRNLHSTIKIKINKNDVFQGLFEIESVMSPKDYTPTGMEFFLVLQSNINNGVKLNNSTVQPEFWTDENGMKMMRRIKDFRRSFNYTKDELVADNFYPVNFAISMRKKEDQSYDAKEGDYDKINNDDPVITIFNDRSQSGGALQVGQLLLDLNRWSEGNDGKGLPENIREGPSSDGYFTVKNYIMFNHFEKKDFVYNLVQKRPILASIYQKNYGIKKLEKIELDYLRKLENGKSLVDQLIFVKNTDSNCFEIDFYHIDSTNTIIQFYNKHDPYFSQSGSCDFKFNMQHMPNHEIYEVTLNTLLRKDNTPKKEIDIKAHFLKAPLKEAFYTVQPQDFKTFLFSTLK